MLYHSLSHFEKFEMRISTLLHWNKWKSDVYMVFDVKIWFDKIPEKKFWTNIYPTLSNYPVFSICMQLHYSTSVQIDNIWTNILCKTSTRVMIKMSIGIDRLRWVTNNGIFHLIFFIQSDLWLCGISHPPRISIRLYSPGLSYWNFYSFMMCSFRTSSWRCVYVLVAHQLTRTDIKCRRIFS